MPFDMTYIIIYHWRIYNISSISYKLFFTLSGLLKRIQQVVLGHSGNLVMPPKKDKKEKSSRRDDSESDDSVKVVTGVNFHPPVSWFQHWSSWLIFLLLGNLGRTVSPSSRLPSFWGFWFASSHGWASTQPIVFGTAILDTSAAGSTCWGERVESEFIKSKLSCINTLTAKNSVKLSNSHSTIGWSFGVARF